MLNKIIFKTKGILTSLGQIQYLAHSLTSSQEVQTLLKLGYYKYLSQRPERLPDFSQVGFKAYSQFEEDGILLYIFSLIGTINQKVVEICAGNGKD
jgi:hypothetical protein